MMEGCKKNTMSFLSHFEVHDHVQTYKLDIMLVSIIFHHKEVLLNGSIITKTWMHIRVIALSNKAFDLLVRDKFKFPRLCTL